mmetsp:Transcript_48672/g.137624  ORF Transcript_48672/g.137624 Transcript_48672/m.137624 type:complete len:234 (+) Transcript_48672:644-1345(+)
MRTVMHTFRTTFCVARSIHVLDSWTCRRSCSQALTKQRPLAEVRKSWMRVASGRAHPPPSSAPPQRDGGLFRRLWPSLAAGGSSDRSRRPSRARSRAPRPSLGLGNSRSIAMLRNSMSLLAGPSVGPSTPSLETALCSKRSIRFSARTRARLLQRWSRRPMILGRIRSTCTIRTLRAMRVSREDRRVSLNIRMNRGALPAEALSEGMSSKPKMLSPAMVMLASASTQDWKDHA